jgi:hypothetical protein
MPSRRAYTLVELLLVITLAALVLGGVAALIRGVWLAKNAAEDHRAMIQSIERLSAHFREDVHASSSVESENDKVTMQLRSRQQVVVVYEFKENSVHRTVMSLDQVVQRDEFDLPPETTVEFETPTGDTGGIAAIKLSYPLTTTQSDLADRRTLRIEAAVGISPSRSHAPRGNALPGRSASRTSE